MEAFTDTRPMSEADRYKQAERAEISQEMFKKIDAAFCGNSQPQGKVFQLPVREVSTILIAAAMCVGKHPHEVEDNITDIRNAALGLAKALIE